MSLPSAALKEAESAIAICQDCGLPFCSTTCQDDVIHKAQECALFLQRRIKFDNVDQASHRHPLYKVCTKKFSRDIHFPICTVCRNFSRSSVLLWARVLQAPQRFLIKVASIYVRIEIQPRSKHYKWLLNKPYVNEVTLTGQNPPLKCC